MSEMESYISEMKEIFKAMVEDKEFAHSIAIYYKHLYKSLVDEGFSRTDAMQILCSFKITN